MIGQSNPDLMLARQQLEQSGVMSPGMRLRLVGQGIDPSSVEAQAAQGALSAGGPGAGIDTQGALATAAPTADQMPPGQIDRSGGGISGGSKPINRSGGSLPDWAPPVGKAQQADIMFPDEAPPGQDPLDEFMRDNPPSQPLQPSPPAAQPGATGSPAAAAPAAAPGAATPAPGQTPGQGGQPAQMPDPTEIAQRSVNAPAAEKKAITEQLEAKGIDVEKAYGEWLEKLGGEKAPDLKLSKEDKGMFLLEFGLRMMTASARTGALDAAGQAGLGTLGSYRNEMERRRAAATEQTTEARKGALALTGLQVDAQAKGPRGSDVLADNTGDAFFVGPNGQPVYLTDGGKRIKLDPNMRSRGMSGPSVFQQKITEYINTYSGGDESKVTPEMRKQALAFAGSGMTEDQLRQEAALLAAKAADDMLARGGMATPPGGTGGKVLFEWTEDEWDRWQQRYIEQVIRNAKSGSYTGGEE